MVSRPTDYVTSDTDDGDDEKMRQFMEAADTTLLTNTMFQASSEERNSIKPSMGDAFCVQNVSSSQRFLIKEEITNVVDFVTTGEIRRHIAKKFTELIANYVEFCDLKTTTIPRKPWKSRVTLFNGAGCFVKPYEEFEFASKGPTQRPIIKTRKLDPEQGGKQEEFYENASVTASDVLNGNLTAGWVSKRERKDKVFYYKRNAFGILHLMAKENEFTKIRKKNQWNESKIKQHKKQY